MSDVESVDASTRLRYGWVNQIVPEDERIEWIDRPNAFGLFSSFFLAALLAIVSVGGYILLTRLNVPSYRFIGAWILLLLLIPAALVPIYGVLKWLRTFYIVTDTAIYTHHRFPGTRTKSMRFETLSVYGKTQKLPQKMISALFRIPTGDLVVRGGRGHDRGKVWLTGVKNYREVFALIDSRAIESATKDKVYIKNWGFGFGRISWFDETINSKEAVVRIEHPHYLHYFGELVYGALGAIAGLVSVVLTLYAPSLTPDFVPEFLTEIQLIAGAGLFVTGLATFSYALIRRAFHFYALTDKRIIERRGILNTSVNKVEHEAIQNTSKTQKFAQKVVSKIIGLSIGNILIFTAGTDLSEQVLLSFPNYEEATRKISEFQINTDGHLQPNASSNNGQGQQSGSASAGSD